VIIPSNAAPSAAGRIAHDVDVAGGFECRCHAGVVGDVERQTLGEVEVLQRTRITGGADHAVTASDEFSGDGAADPATGSGDQDRGHGVDSLALVGSPNAFVNRSVYFLLLT
jgi:hypothetical protein